MFEGQSNPGRHGNRRFTGGTVFDPQVVHKDPFGGLLGHCSTKGGQKEKEKTGNHHGLSGDITRCCQGCHVTGGLRKNERSLGGRTSHVTHIRVTVLMINTCVREVDLVLLDAARDKHALPTCFATYPVHTWYGQHIRRLIHFSSYLPEPQPTRNKICHDRAKR